MSPTIMWSVLAAVAVLAISLAVAAAKARYKARAAARVREAHPIEPGCASSGHLYRSHGTGLQCLRCGNYIARIEGEVYGPAESDLVERRREPR
jgi:hypothetical protein